MKDFINFPILIIDDELDSDTAGGRALREITRELKSRDLSVIESLKGNDGRLMFLSHPNISCVMIDWFLGFEVDDDYPDPVGIIKEIREKSSKVPIFLITDKLTTQEIPNKILEDINGYIWKTEDTPHFIAGRIVEAAEKYIADAYPPFFKDLVDYTRASKYSWHTPGHSGGVAFLKTISGRLFFDFFGENTLRADLSVSVPELGSLLEHTEAIGRAEKFAANTFGAKRTYFVTNGTSTANKMIFHSAVSSKDVVLVDRNCHKSIMHALIMTGADPMYLFPTRNSYGIIGPIPLGEYDRVIKELKKKKEEEKKEGNARLAVITNSTYDGLCYNVKMILDNLEKHVDIFHFDEAWFAYANFHGLYKGRFAMSPELNGQNNKGKNIIFSTHSTHKLLAAFSQASMIHVRGDIDHDKFNEAFMMHTSTSPQYGIIASLDAATKMMEDSGPHLVNEAIEEAIIFRKKMVEIKEEIERDNKHPKNWWFSVWQPDSVKNLNIGDLGKEDKLIPKDWLLKNEKDNSWHRFNIGKDEDIDKDKNKKNDQDKYIMLDPIKVTVLTPGLEKEGNFSPDGDGIPACVVTRFLRKRGIVVEKTGLYSFLVLFSIGITKGKSGSLIATLHEFKKLYENQTPLADVFPEIIPNLPGYKDYNLKEFCQAVHEFYKKIGIIQKAGKAYSFEYAPKIPLRPAEAYQAMVQNKVNVEEVKKENLREKTSAVMLVPYPPGIPIIMPGEKFNDEILDYLETLIEFNEKFKDFEVEIHGLITDEKTGKNKYRVYCVNEEYMASKEKK